MVEKRIEGKKQKNLVEEVEALKKSLIKKNVIKQDDIDAEKK